MKSLTLLVPIVAGLLIVLTYLLVQGTFPDSSQHERVLDALRTAILQDAVLERDVLRARTGLLRNYDPFVRSIRSLRDAVKELAIAREITGGAARTEVDTRLAALTAAVDEQEGLLEAFKSDHAVLQNSSNYFNYLGDRLIATGSSAEAAAIGALTTAMLRFVNHPEQGTGRQVEGLLNQLARHPDGKPLAENLRSLIRHGRLIVARLSRLDGLVSQLQVTATGEQARAFQDSYLKAYAQVTKQAGIFRILLYVVALTLVAYVAFLFARLSRNAQILKERLDFERLIAAISTRFISLPLHRIPDDIASGLARLVEHTGVDRAQIIVGDGHDTEFPRSLSIAIPAGAARDPRFADRLGFASNWSLKEFESHGCIYVSSLDKLPAGHARDWLQARHIRSWLAIPIRYGDERLGFLLLDSIATEKHWSEDDIALLRTVVEIFANAIVRARNETEREALQARLNHAQRLEAIGTLAGGIAHEFNNILGAVLGSAEMALEQVAENSPANRYLRQILAGGRRAQDIIERVLTFGRRRNRQHRPIRPEPVVEEAVAFVRASLADGLTLQARLDAPEAWIMGDATELHQVVMNLCTNAAQAMAQRGIITLALDAVEISETLELSHGTLPPGRHVRLAVSDTGEGITSAAMAHIFEPFFTTKPAGQGTGLGLSAVHGIVTSKNGVMNVESRPNAGTTFEIYFPQLDTASAAEDVGRAAHFARGHGETILVVDDDPQLVLLGEEMVAALGYEPVGFDRSSVALDAFRAEPERFDLVLTDEIMPAMTGTELARAVHAMRPELPIVLMTGEGAPPDAAGLRAAGIREILRKPLVLGAVADCLARNMSKA